MTTSRLTPGHSKPCRSCAHRLDMMHPSPCGQVRWDGPRHIKPQLERIDGVVVCGDFAPAETQLVEGVLS